LPVVDRRDIRSRFGSQQRERFAAVSTIAIFRYYLTREVAKSLCAIAADNLCAGSLFSPLGTGAFLSIGSRSRGRSTFRTRPAVSGAVLSVCAPGPGAYRSGLSDTRDKKPSIVRRNSGTMIGFTRNASHPASRAFA
jgi:hypothetical protein